MYGICTTASTLTDKNSFMSVGDALFEPSVRFTFYAGMTVAGDNLWLQYLVAPRRCTGGLRYGMVNYYIH
jgi:hypothetical protein